MPRLQRTSAGLSQESEAEDRAAIGTATGRPRTPGRPSTNWMPSGSGHQATIDGRDYRVTKYPADSPLATPYGAYAEGRFIGGGATLDAVKGRCNAHAARLRLRHPPPE
jgi:hypothetical protein